MLGTIVNTIFIVVGSIAGSTLNKRISSKYQESLFVTLGICSIVIGLKSCLQNLPNSHYPILFIICLTIGSIVGTRLNLSDKFNNLVTKHSKNSNLGEGLSTAVLLFCIGTLSILGPVQSALKNDNTLLFTNAMLDLVTSSVLSATYGIGIIWAAPILFCWQSSFYLIAKYSENAISNELMTELQIVGGILIIASGISILGLKNCKTINLLPSLLLPIIFFSIKNIKF